MSRLSSNSAGHSLPPQELSNSIGKWSFFAANKRASPRVFLSREPFKSSKMGGICHKQDPLLYAWFAPTAKSRQHFYSRRPRKTKCDNSNGIHFELVVRHDCLCYLTRGSLRLALAAACGASRLRRTLRLTPNSIAVPFRSPLWIPGILAKSCCSHGSDCRDATDGGGASSGLYRGGSCPAKRSANSAAEQSALRNRGASSISLRAVNIARHN
eukprot:COSAG02_NODE_5728_length_4088_cov_1.782652_2_plen_213_part_00